jgi:hypothetical protein
MILVSLSQGKSRYDNFWRTSDIMRAKKPHSFDGFCKRWRYNVIEDLCLWVSALSILQLRALLKLTAQSVICTYVVRMCSTYVDVLQPYACMYVQQDGCAMCASALQIIYHAEENAVTVTVHSIENRGLLDETVTSVLWIKIMTSVAAAFITVFRASD